MKKKILLILLSACALCVSCGDEQHPGMEPQDDPVFDVGYRIGTRADVEGDPKNKDTYTIMSYRVVDQNNTPTANPHVAGGDQRGYYAYLEEGNAAFVEENFLIPTRIKNENLEEDYPYEANNPIVRDNNYGQRLQAGKYKTAVLHPAVPVLNSNNLELGSFMVVLPRNIDCPVYAPMPDNLLDMTVEKNLAVYEIDDSHELYITLAKMKAYFYSSSDEQYTISSVGLLNAGSSGWFNPYTGITYPNYGDDPHVFSLNGGADPILPADWKVSPIKGGSDALGNVTDADNGVGSTYSVHYLMDDEAIFATDYRGQSGGGEHYTYVRTLILRITVSMPIPGAVSPDPTDQTITADIPVSLKIERGKLYNFYFDMRSGIFRISYSINNGSGTAGGWDEGNSDTEGHDIGDTIPYGSFDFTRDGNGWVSENTSDGGLDIGGN